MNAPIIPLMEELDGSISYMRQRDTFDPATHKHSAVTIVGCGGIGSFAAFALAKLGIQHFTLIDPDKVERHNLPNQMFPLDTLDGQKADVTAELIREFAIPASILPVNAPLQAVDHWQGIVISALDSMEARAELWAKVKGNIRVPLLLDGRLGGQNIRLFAIKPSNPEDRAYYENSLHTDDEAVEDVCTAQSIIDVGFQVASLITRAVRLHLTEQPVEREVYMNQATLQLAKG